MSQEEFFMYLTIGLIVLIPVGIRLYRYLAFKRQRQMRLPAQGPPGS